MQNKAQKLSKTLDFVSVQNKHKHFLHNSISQYETKTTSDNKLVITRMKTQWFEVFNHTNRAKKNASQRKINNVLSVTNKEKQEEYQQVMQESLIDEPNKDLINLKKDTWKVQPKK